MSRKIKRPKTLLAVVLIVYVMSIGAIVQWAHAQRAWHMIHDEQNWFVG